MKSKDLMVGDFILVERNEGIYGGPVWKQPGKVLEIYQDEIKVLFADENGDNEYDEILTFLPHEVDGLPITPERLEKNGFEKLDFSHFQIGDRRLVLDADGRWDGPLSWNWVVTEMDTNAKGQPVVLDYYVATINCVHELQRALRCVGLFELANNIKL